MATERMYELAFRYKKTKLWKKLHDTDIFAIKFSDGTIGYCCVMGMAGELNALALYPGEKAFQSYLKIIKLPTMQIRSEFEYHELMLCQDCLQCAFENKDELSDDEVDEVRAYAKTHGITLRGANAFAQFVRYRPYYYPWQLSDAADQERICEAMEACIALAELLETQHKSEIGLQDYIIQISRKIPVMEKRGNVFVLAEPEDYADLSDLLPDQHPSPAVTNDLTAARIKRLKKQGAWECEVLRMLEPVQEDPEQVPYFPVVLMAVDSDSGFLYPLNMVENFEEHPEALLDTFAERLLEMETCPKVIAVNDERTYALLQNLCNAVGIKLMLTDEELDSLEEAKAGLFAAMPPDDPFDGQPEDPGFDMFEEKMYLLMQMSDSELRTMPKELAHQMLQLAEEGMLPEEVARKLQRALGKSRD